MKIVVALDSFKGTLSAADACRIVTDSIREIVPAIDIIAMPMADGGEGTTDAIIGVLNGTMESLEVMGPLPDMRVKASFGLVDDGQSAVIEMASASGLPLLKSSERAPLRTTTYGTGELIRAAIESDVKTIWLGVGGSATVDGGMGAARALGWRFLDKEGKEVGHGGGNLSAIASIQAPRISGLPRIEVLSDVTNLLCGENGAAHVYGPQKGASPDQVKALDAGLRHFAERVEEQLDIDLLRLPGGGAAGGLAAGAVAFMGASIVPGIERVMDLYQIDKVLADADWVLTGEGKFDGQSLQGKVVSGIVGRTRHSKVRVGVLAGTVRVGVEEQKQFGVDVAYATEDASLTLEENLARAGEALATTARRFVEEQL